MTRKQIEKAATESCVIDNSIFNPKYVPFYEHGFIDGANWRVNAAWHDPREESPSGFRLLLMQDTSGEIDLGYMLPRGIMRWAYVSDLIPDDGKEGGQ